MERRNWDAVVIGGGFFGAYLALLLKDRVESVVVLERERDLLLRASYNNQARVHAGYHYPRSLMTAVRSCVNFPRFVDDFRPCIRSDFEKYYAIAQFGSKVTAAQFRLFMERVGAPLNPPPKRVERLFDSSTVEKVFAVREYAFDAMVLRRIMRERLATQNLPVEFGVQVERIQPGTSRQLRLDCTIAGETVALDCDWVFNCTYSAINRLNHHSNLPLVPLKHELTELALVEIPPELEGTSVTLMCGPFFSLMPFPDRGLWTLSHVRYTPHHYWRDTNQTPYRDAYAHFEQCAKTTNAPFMIRDAARYVPALAKCRHRDSLWEVKTVLPQSELDDGRPILFHRCSQLPHLISVLGGKLDNVYDIPQDLERIGLTERTAPVG
jgi:glycine/D-amino acid oxidase-like deaminating enzyme